MILDTNALSAFADGEQKVRELIATQPGPYLPVIALGEYRYGLMQLRDRNQRLAWLERLKQYWNVLEINAETSTAYAEIRSVLRKQASPIPVNDVWIAALARQHGLGILSSDPHFDVVPGINRISW